MENIDKSQYTPMMRQYLTIKEDYNDAIVFFRLGDFYEMFFTDAFLASRELEIQLTGRDAGTKEKVPKPVRVKGASLFYRVGPIRLGANAWGEVDLSEVKYIPTRKYTANNTFYYYVNGYI